MTSATVFTDLDGTLLDPGGVLGDAARRALGFLAGAGVPVIPLTSKTCDELAAFLADAIPGGAGAVENGAALLLPGGQAVPLPGARDAAELERVLEALAREAGVAATPLSGLDDAEVRRRTGLPADRIAAARARRWSVPFVAGEAAAAALEEFAARRGLALTRGGTFFHLSGRHDKSGALAALSARLTLTRPWIGLGDAPNDAAFLSACDVAVAMPPADGSKSPLETLVFGVRRSLRSGGVGWAEAVARALPEVFP